MPAEKSITIAEAVAQVVAQLDGPVSSDEFIARVLAIRPSQARDPTASIRNHLRWDAAGRSIVFLDRHTISPLRIVMQGVRFRVPLSRQEVERGALYLFPAFHPFLRQEIPYDQMCLVDEAGRPLPTKVVLFKEKIEGLFGPFDYQRHALYLSDWFRARQVRRQDSILITIQDWERGCFRLEHEPARRRKKHRREIEQKNEELADLLYEFLENARYERVFVEHAVTTAYARMSDPRGYPGDHWSQVVEGDRRMRTDGREIRYAESVTPLEAIFVEAMEGQPGPSKEPFSPQQGRKVYRFKAALYHRPGLWRRIEIQGDQTLADFNAILVDAFNHDWDHMAGFWKRVRRGSTKRYREIDLGDVDPLGQGSGADRHIAGLGLKPGDTLKYVYDFGDWIEHRITLEEIVEPEKGVKYPRIVGRNRPRHRYCQECKAAGKRTVATWVCIDCSEREGRAVLVCEECLDRNHEGHYAEEILY